VAQPLNGSSPGGLPGLAGHPAADGATHAALVVEQHREVIGLSSWVVDAAAQARDTGRALFLLSSNDSRVTYPLETLLAEGNATWVVSRSDGTYYDGVHRHSLGWDGRRFAPSGQPPAAVAPTREGPGTLRIELAELHPAAADLELGGACAAVAEILTGGPPAGWGLHEPVTQPWSTRELTRLARSRAPAPSSLTLVAGPPTRPLLGLVEGRRVTTGVYTRARIATGMPHAPGSDALALLDTLADTLASHPVQSMLATWQPGRADATRAPVPTPPAIPLGVLFGADALRNAVWTTPAPPPPRAASSARPRTGNAGAASTAPAPTRPSPP
jgi:hypothetical protein